MATSMRLCAWAVLAAVLLSLAGCWDDERELGRDADKAGKWVGSAADRAGDAVERDADETADWQRRSAQRDGPEAADVGFETVGAAARAYAAVMEEAWTERGDAADDARQRFDLADDPSRRVVFEGFPAGADIWRRNIVENYVHGMIYRLPVPVSPTCKVEWIEYNGQHQVEVIFCFRLTTRPWTDEEPTATAYCLQECAGLWKKMQQQSCASAGTLAYSMMFYLPVGAKVQEVTRIYPANGIEDVHVSPATGSATAAAPAPPPPPPPSPDEPKQTH
jgi:hypothetical protein